MAHQRATGFHSATDQLSWNVYALQYVEGGYPLPLTSGALFYVEVGIS